jgi:dTDP-4-amino-4,6-dideoxygalactose transaminase
MMALGLEPGDEVITSSFTYVATAEVIALLKLTPVLVDVLPDSFNIDPEAVKKAITPKTKAIVPVHLFGQCADMAPLMEIAEEHGLYVIEDNAQAIGAKYTFPDGSVKSAGTIGHFGSTSFFPSKNLGCYGDGGAFFTNDDNLHTRGKMMANHGQSRQYVHDEIGVNSRLDSIQAAILRIKLRRLDSYCNARRKAADYYDAAFGSRSECSTPHRSANSTHVFHQYTLKLDGVNRDEMRQHMMDNNVPAMIYYPIPLHMQKAYTDPRYKQGDFPVTEDLCKRVISFPMHTELSTDQQDLVINTAFDFIDKNK